MTVPLVCKCNYCNVNVRGMCWGVGSLNDPSVHEHVIVISWNFQRAHLVYS